MPLIIVINSNLDPILHCLATVHWWQTDERTDDKRCRPKNV